MFFSLNKAFPFVVPLELTRVQTEVKHETYGNLLEAVFIVDGVPNAIRGPAPVPGVALRVQQQIHVRSLRRVLVYKQQARISVEAMLPCWGLMNEGLSSIGNNTQCWR